MTLSYSTLYKTISSRLPKSLSTAFSSSSHNRQMAPTNVEEFVKSTIANNKVAIFSKSWCPYCQSTKSLFATQFPEIQAKIVELDERDDGQEIQEYLLKTTSQRTVPSVFINEKHIGGNDAVQAEYKAGRLAVLKSA